MRDQILDVLRRRIALLLSKGALTSRPSQTNIFTKILIVRPNHRLGNQLLLTPLLQEIEKHYPGVKISLLVKGNLAPEIFKHYKLDRLYCLPRKPLKDPFKYVSVLWMTLLAKYDIAMNVIPSSSSGLLFTSWTRANFKISDHQILEGDNSAAHMAKAPVYTFRKLLLPSNSSLGDHVYPLNLRLSGSELNKGRVALYRIFNNNLPTIILYTYATRNKLYPPAWWEEFYKKLIVRHANHNILEVLPLENVSQLSSPHKTFYSRDIREIASLIANASVFIGADSGMMHLSSSSGTPTIGLFKVTSVERYAPYGNESFAVDTNVTTIDIILSRLNDVLSVDETLV